MNNKFKTNIFLFESARPIINHSLKIFLSAFCVIPRYSVLFIIISGYTNFFLFSAALLLRFNYLPDLQGHKYSNKALWLFGTRCCLAFSRFWVCFFRFRLRFVFRTGFSQMSSPLPRYWVNMPVVCMFSCGSRHALIM